jgi:MSHA type pilus biogenesis protein MshL
VPRLTVLRMLARAAGLRLDLGRNATNNDRVSVDAVNEPVDQAARAAVLDVGWAVAVEGDRLRVLAERTVSLRLNFPHLARSYTAAFGGNTLGGGGQPSATTPAGGTSSANTAATTTTGAAAWASGALASATAVAGLAGEVTLTYKADDRDAWKAVEEVAKAILGERGSLAIHQDTGIVWLRGRPDLVDEASQALRRIDQELSRQVYLEVSVIDVTLSDRTRWGIDWQKVFTLGHGSWSTLTLVQPPIGIAGSLASSAFTATLARGGRPDSIVLRALEEQGQARILSQPRLLVTNGQTALLKVGEVIPYIASVTQTVAGQSGSVVATPTISQVQSGLTIAISPRIQEREVLLQLTPVLNEVTSFKTFSVNGTSFDNPVVATKSLTTVARARTGETVVLGGLIDTVARNSREGLPILSHVPILGVLFRNEDRNASSRELVIVITPTIRDASPGS